MFGPAKAAAFPNMYYLSVSCETSSCNVNTARIRGMESSLSKYDYIILHSATTLTRHSDSVARCADQSSSACSCQQPAGQAHSAALRRDEHAVHCHGSHWQLRHPGGQICTRKQLETRAVHAGLHAISCEPFLLFTLSPCLQCRPHWVLINF